MNCSGFRFDEPPTICARIPLRELFLHQLPRSRLDFVVRSYVLFVHARADGLHVLSGAYQSSVLYVETRMQFTLSSVSSACWTPEIYKLRGIVSWSTNCDHAF